MQVSPSLLAADFGNIAAEIEMINSSRASMLHLDVMDGVFVPNISFGFPVLQAVGKLTSKPMDVHLMIQNPQNYIDKVASCGADIMNVHQEACVHLHRTVEAIRQSGMKAAVTLNPATPVETLVDILPELHMVLLMSVDPGFGGQKFIQNTLQKIRRLKAMITEQGLDTLIEVDGGINAETGRMCASAGADILVAGSYVFKAESPHAAIETLAAL